MEEYLTIENMQKYGETFYVYTLSHYNACMSHLKSEEEDLEIYESSSDEYSLKEIKMIKKRIKDLKVEICLIEYLLKHSIEAYNSIHLIKNNIQEERYS